MTDNRDLDPESKGLQFRILKHGDRWVLEPANPQFPRTPDEAAAIMEARATMPTDPQGRIVIAPAARDRLDAEPGDVVSLATVVDAWAAAFSATLLDAFEPLLETLADFVDSVADPFIDVFEGDDDGRDSRLPEHISEARARRDEQREQARGQAGRDWLESDE